MRIFAVLITVVLLMSVRVTLAADVYTGTWTLDLAKSGGNSRSQVLTIRITGNVESYRSDLLIADGTRQVTHYTAAYDGKEHPSETVVTSPKGIRTLRADTVILRKIDEFTRERIWMRDGRVIRRLERVVSGDGKVLTSRLIDVDEHGQEHPAGTLVFGKTFR